MDKNIAVFVGSLRKESLNRKMAKQLMTLAPESLNLQIIEIGHLPLYNQDLDDNQTPPEEWIRFRDEVKPFNGVIFVTPEYNRSIPGVLKNAIDIGSRPYGKSVWENKPTAVISVSPGAVGGFGANHHLRQCLVFLNMPTMQQPESYIGQAGDLFDAHGEISKKSTREFIQTFINKYADWIETFSKSH